MFSNQNPPNNNLIGIGNPIASPMDSGQSQQNLNYNGMQQQQQHQQQSPQHQHQTQQQQQSRQQAQQQQNATNRNVRRKPFVKIIEQPASKALRFRYECEGRSAGSIPGVGSTPENKTYPTIEIVGHKGRAVVVVSCVTKDMPYRPHPHNLVGKEGCKKGVCTLEINADTMRAVFSNLGIQCVKKKDIDAALRAREDIRVDPFKTGFSHRSQPASIDLNAVRLCFQVFMEGEQKGKFNQPLPPVVSEPIYDKKAMSDLVICRLCSCSASVLGNTQIILLCEKVAKEDIAIRFFEEKNGQVVWEAFGEFQHTDVHKQTAITFKTPRYHTHDINEPAKVFIQLRRPSDGVTSDALPFEYVPLDSDPVHLKRKRQKTGGDPIHMLLKQQQKQQQNELQDGRQANLNCWKANIPAIKTEPRDVSPQPYGQYRAKSELTPSPQPLSPSNNYVQNDTTTPYNIHPPTTINNLQMLSPNHQYGANGGVGNNVQNLNTTSPTMNLIDFNMQQSALSLHHQSQQQQQHHHPQTQYQTNMFGGSEWEQKFNANTNATINQNTNTNNLSNLNNNTNPFVMQQDMLANTPNTLGVNESNQSPWNLLSNTMHNQQVPLQQSNLLQQHHHHHHHQQQQQQQQQQHYSLTNNQNNLVTNANNTNDTTNNMNGDGPTYSNLLTFDSDQLVPMNTGAQQLELNSEDLQISNLSIST